MDAQDSVETDISTNDTEEQQIRAFLRERFLRFIAKLSAGQEAEIYTQELTTVTGKIRGFDKHMENVVIQDLKTPYLPIDKAILRSSDIIAIKLLNVTAKNLTD